MKKLKKILLYPSKMESDKRFQEKFDKALSQLKKMDENQFGAEYVKIKSKYQYKSNMSNFFIISFILWTIGSIWVIFSGYIKNLIYVVVQNFEILQNQKEIINAVFFTGVILIFAIMFILMFIVFLNMREIYQIYQYLLIIEEERENRNEKLTK